MTAPSAGRSVEQIEEPFKNGLFAGLSLDHVSVVQAPDPYWEAYSQNGDAQQLGRSWAAMMRAANGPNFAAALAPDRNSEPFLDELSARLAARIDRSEEHTSELPSLMRISYAVFCLKKKKANKHRS